MDARRMSDNELVLIKKVRSGSAELRIACSLYSDTLRNDPRNHCVPVLEILRDSEDEAWSYMVMPFLRYIDDPPFESVENVLDCCEQLLVVSGHLAAHIRFAELCLLGTRLHT